MQSPDDTEEPRAYRYRRLVAAKRYIEEHFAEPIDLNQVAGTAFFSRFHFLRLFRQAWGRTPNQYLIAVRLREARILLTAGVSVQDACFRVGFESPTTFAALFRKHSGLTPSAFRQRALLRSEAIRREPLRFIPGCFAEGNGWKSNFQ